MAILGRIVFLDGLTSVVVSVRRLAGRAVACAAGVALLVGCGSAPKPVPVLPTTVAATVQASTQVNPSAARRPSPIQLKLYELRSAAAFGSADFMSLFQNDQAALGAEMVGREEMTLMPGESKPYAKTLSPDTRFIGVVAAYRDLERATWRTLVAVQPARTNKLLIQAGELAVSAATLP